MLVNESSTGRPSKPTLSESIRDGLVELIVSGELKAGERLIETRIAADFGTSQAPVREALRELEGLGLVESRPRRGRHVLPFVEQTIREAYVVRAALEEAATRLAMLNDRLPLDAMRADVADMYRCAADDDVRAMGLASARFHRRVVLAGSNFLLERAWEGLQIESRTAIALVVTKPLLSHVADEHAELLAVLESGDVEAACLHTRAHQWAYADLPHDMHGTARAVRFP
ncbi:DNA-binding transcriptional regulator, GntR family [Asanoa hainanensis]|uniref:DNA-binding transcriptional regulator, GntR family n=1 Tax=Asanoa hainanensis TaxID=560556 RepID=A0A239H2N2_9ACTN|nr:GntR family transcriptional regulator [Asanoa hainanensis]SNS75441.1 DNA-binding transcriptional regulator, GntR family [Asanoa hainanensis]